MRNRSLAALFLVMKGLARMRRRLIFYAFREEVTRAKAEEIHTHEVYGEDLPVR